MMKKKEKFVEAASSTFQTSSHYIQNKNERIANKKYITNGKEVNAVENVSTYADKYICWLIFSIINHMLIVWAWMLVNELH